MQAAAAAKLQKSSVFQRLVQNQKKKYDRRAEEEEQEREADKQRERERLKGRPITKEDIDNRQMEMRIKYGSKTKQKEQQFNSSRMNFANQAANSN